MLRIDDRGIGQTTGGAPIIRIRYLEKDLRTAINYLRKQTLITVGQIGLIGHSEGALISFMAARGNQDVSFVISLAGPGIPLKQLLIDQNRSLLKSIGLTDAYINSYLGFYSQIITKIPKCQTSQQAYLQSFDIFKKWKEKAGQEIVQATTGIKDSISEVRFITAMSSQANSKWLTSLINESPKKYLKKLTCPVLALNGDKDFQVSSKTNLPAIRAALTFNPKTEIVELAGLNHLFQSCTTCLPAEYFSLEETISPAVLDLITKWFTTL